MAKAAQFEADDFVGPKPNMAPSMAHLSIQEELRGSSLALNKRSMVLDEDRFEEQFLRCPVCRERFQSDKLPRMLPCHHSFCHTCIEQMYATATEHRNNFHSSIRLPISAPVSAVNVSCPTCRANFVATEDNIRRLPTDHRVVQLMDFVNHTERYTVTFCSKHSLQPLNFFCEPCVKPVCRDCTVLDHKEVEGHLVMDLEDALAKYTPVLDSAIAEMDGEAVCLEEKRIALEAVSSALDKIRVSLLEEVKTCMARLRQLLDEREKALEAKVHEEAGKEQEKLVEKAEMLESRRSTLMEQSERLKRAKMDNNVEEMFRIHQEVRKYRAWPPMRIREVDDGLLTTLMLNTRDEAMLSSRINNFGDVTSKVETTSSRLRTGKSTTLRSTSLR